MLTTRVPAFRCGTDWPAGWLVGSDPTMEDDEVHKTFCFSNRNSSCKYYEKYKIKDIKRQKTRNERKKIGNTDILDKQITIPHDH